LLELIDLINQEHEQNRDSWWAEEFQVNFSEFEPKSVTPYCHGKYYCIVDEQGAYILNYKKEKITGYYDHIVNMVEEDGQLYLYSRIGLSYGVYTKEGTLILKDESNGSRGGFFSKVGDRFFASVRRLGGGHNIVNLNTGQPLFASGRRLELVTNNPAYVCTIPDTEDESCITLVELGVGEQDFTRYNHHFNRAIAGPDSIALDFLNYEDGHSILVNGKTGQTFAEGYDDDVISFDGSDFVPISVGSPVSTTQVYNSSGEQVASLPACVVLGMCLGQDGQYLFATRENETSLTMNVFDSVGNLIQVFKNINYLSSFYHTSKGFILGGRNVYSDEKGHELLSVPSGSISYQTFRNGKLFVSYYDHKNKVAKGQFVTIK